ncbi:MAG: nitroreductase family deazaflavin-dependent oxidoreductase [Candidatus Promineifilaceae bacterium]|nr:nitroreductase family deazaflavin-dependent oxidoreductase [Candidatus Promineifilaceae bacterium]
MNKDIERALQSDRLIDITTIGRKSGKPRRIEITFHYLDGDVYISGLPGRRDWYANLVANPEFTFHLKQSVEADLPARATPVLDLVQRRKILASIVEKWGRQDELDAFVQDSPLVAVWLEGVE